MSYRGIDQNAADTVELRRALRDLQNRADAAGLGNRNLGQTVRTGNAPPILTGLTGYAQMRRVFLAWNDSPAADLARYELQASTSPVFAGASTFNTSNPWFTFEDATTGTTYYFRVRAVNIAGNASAYSNTLSLTPGGLTTTDVGGSSNTSPIVLIERQTVNLGTGSGPGVNNISFTTGIDASKYIEYFLVFDSMQPDVDNIGQVWLRVRVGGSWKTAATDYTYVCPGHETTNVIWFGFSIGAAQIALNQYNAGIYISNNVNRKAVSGWIRLAAAPDGNGRHSTSWYMSYLDSAAGAGDFVMFHGAGAYKGGDTDVIDGIRILFSDAAKIQQGSFYLYGVRDLR